MLSKRALRGAATGQLSAHDRALSSVSLAATMLVWGSSFAVTRAALTDAPPFLFATLRFVIASAVLLGLAWARGVARLPQPVPWRTLLLLGGSGVTLYYVCYNLSLAYTTASEAALVQGTLPAATTLLGAALLGERLGRAKALAALLAVAGVTLVALAGGGGGDAPNRLLGDALMLGTVAAWSLYTVLAKRLRADDAGAHYVTLTAWSTLVGTLLLLPAAAFDLVTRPPRMLTSGVWVAALYLGVISSGVTLVLYMRALRAFDAGQAGMFMNLIPVVGVVVGVLFLGESLAVGQTLGGALVLLGVWLATRTATTT